MEHKIIFAVSGGVGDLDTYPQQLHPGDTLVVELRDYDIDGVDEDQLQEDERGDHYCGGFWCTIPVVARDRP